MISRKCTPSFFIVVLWSPFLLFTGTTQLHQKCSVMRMVMKHCAVIRGSSMMKNGFKNI